MNELAKLKRQEEYDKYYSAYKEKLEKKKKRSEAAGFEYDETGESSNNQEVALDDIQIEMAAPHHQIPASLWRQLAS